MSGVAEAPVDLAGKALGAAGEKVAGSFVEDFAKAVSDGANWAVENLLTAWLRSPDPDVTGANSPTVWLQQRLLWLVPIVMLGAVLVGAYRLAMTRRVEPGRDLAAALVRTVAVSLATGIVLTALLGIGDAFTDWILKQSDVQFGGAAVLVAARGGYPSMLVIVLGLIVILTQLIQFGLMMVRNAMIVLLAGVLPVAAASSNTAMGKQWWSKSCGWLLAFTLYKPVAALIYATAFRMTNNDQSPTTVISGIFLMVLAVFALPALLRFCVPATAAMASGNAGAAAGAVVAGTVALGAKASAGGLAGVAGGFAGRVPTQVPPMPMGAASGGGGGWGAGPRSAGNAALVMQGANALRGKGSNVVGGNES